LQNDQQKTYDLNSPLGGVDLPMVNNATDAPNMLLNTPETNFESIPDGLPEVLPEVGTNLIPDNNFDANLNNQMSNNFPVQDVLPQNNFETTLDAPVETTSEETTVLGHMQMPAAPAFGLDEEKDFTVPITAKVTPPNGLDDIDTTLIEEDNV
jgi:hypothetical protein